MRSILDTMAGMGQIASFKFYGQQMYMFFPFLIGIYEFQLDRLDKEFTDLVEDYAPTLFKTVGGFAPSMMRVIPVNTKIEPQLQIQRYEDLRQMIDHAKSFRVQECICRKEKALQGHPCNHTREGCLSFSREEGAYDYFKLTGRVISKEEAFKVLSDAENEGLVHCTMNVQKNSGVICNCCTCCCGILRAVREIKAPYALAKSNFHARIDQASCNECGICKAERCPMDAIEEKDGVYRVLEERCIGCGVCTVVCPTGSITLQARPENDTEVPPKSVIEWSLERAANRSATRLSFYFGDEIWAWSQHLISDKSRDYCGDCRKSPLEERDKINDLTECSRLEIFRRRLVF
jgi:Fe-S-cluster-containing hydrogenase component 2